MEHISADILVAGGGLAGLAAAARLGAVGHRVAVIDPAPAAAAAGDDLRTTAILRPGIDTLARAGAWSGMAGSAAPLFTMRLVDAGGVERRPRERADFEAREVQDQPFGWNVPNTAARAALIERLEELDTVRFERGVAVTGFLPRASEVVVRLSDRRQVRARLALAADGRDSTLRQLAGIGVRRWEYGQSALVFPVTHPEPHDGVSTEIHRTGGPLTLVPMPDREGRPCSSVVWMVPAARAGRLAALDDAALGAELTAETMGLFGPLSVAGARAVWPIIGQIALAMRGERLALAAEAAHVIPPIGAQGLNMSLADIECLARLIEARPEDPGEAGLLARYEMRRWPETAARVAGVDMLNRFAQAEAQPVRDIRRLGLKAIHDIPPMRHLAMRLGMGATG